MVNKKKVFQIHLEPRMPLPRSSLRIFYCFWQDGIIFILRRASGVSDSNSRSKKYSGSPGAQDHATRSVFEPFFTIHLKKSANLRTWNFGRRLLKLWHQKCS